MPAGTRRSPGGRPVSFGFNGSPGERRRRRADRLRARTACALGAGTPPSLSINNVTVNDGTSGATAAFTVTLSQAADHAGHRRLRARPTARRTPAPTTRPTSGTLTFSPGRSPRRSRCRSTARHHGQAEPDLPGQPVERRRRQPGDDLGHRHDRRHDPATATHDLGHGLVRGDERLGHGLRRPDHDQQYPVDARSTTGRSPSPGTARSPDLGRDDHQPHRQSVCDHQRRL